MQTKIRHLVVFVIQKSHHFRLLEVFAILVLALGGILEYSNIRVIDRARMHYLSAFQPAEREYYFYIRSFFDKLKEAPNSVVLSDARYGNPDNLRSQADAKSEHVMIHSFWQALQLQSRLIEEIGETRRLASSLSQPHRSRLIALQKEVITTRDAAFRDLNQLVPYANGRPIDEPLRLETSRGWVLALESFQARVNAEEVWLLKDIEAQRNRWTLVLYMALLFGTILMAISKMLNWAREANLLPR